jgi:hypothetical protein
LLQADAALFWDYFFSAIAMLILFLILKATFDQEPDEAEVQV